MAAVMNPFEKNSTRQQSNAIAQSDQQRAIAEVQAAMMIARANPRDEMRAMDRILNACSRPSLAEAGVYQYARGGSDISGPSIRLAEAIAQQWGNIQFGIRELDQSGGESTVQAFAWDVETNTRREMTFQVKHERHTKKGVTKLTDPRDVYELVANQGARRLRSCILSIIPGDVVEAATAQCEATLKASADTSPGAIKKIVEAFHAFGVTKEQIEKRIQRRMEAIQPAQILSLKKIYTSLRDGMSTTEDWFEPAGAKTMDDIAAAQAAKNHPAPDPAPVPSDDMGVEVEPIPDFDPELARDDLISLIQEATTKEDLKKVSELPVYQRLKAEFPEMFAEVNKAASAALGRVK